MCAIRATHVMGNVYPNRDRCKFETRENIVQNVTRLRKHAELRNIFEGNAKQKEMFFRHAAVLPNNAIYKCSRRNKRSDVSGDVAAENLKFISAR